MLYTIAGGWIGMFLGLCGLLYVTHKKKELLTLNHIFITLMGTAFSSFLGFIFEYGLTPVYYTVFGALFGFVASYVMCYYFELNKKLYNFSGLIGSSDVAVVNLVLMNIGAIIGFVYWIIN